MARQLHGYTRGGKPKEYFIWSEMVRRCHTPTNHAYPQYGGRGITVCDRWRESFANFIADVGWRPAPGMSIDRIDNNRGYEPGNVRWADDYAQAQNRRNVITVDVGDERVCLKEYCRRHGLKYGTVCSRVKRGWPVALAVTPGLRPYRIKRQSA